MNTKIEEVTKDPANINFKFVPSVIIPEIVEFNHYLKGDSVRGIVHFNKTSQIEFGKRYFYIYNNKISSVLTRPVVGPPPVVGPSYDIFIVLGQSNSAGRGVGGSNNLGLIANDDFANRPNDNIKQWDGSTIIPAVEHLYHNETTSTLMWGFGISFARQYVREHKVTAGNKVLLIGCGVGGTAVLYNNGRGTWDSLDLFPRAVTRINQALHKVGPNSVIKGILWHQGESDADYIFENRKPTHTFATYESTLTQLLNNFRTNIVNDLNTIIGRNQVDTDVKLLMGGLIKNIKNYDTMTNSIKNIVNNNETTNYFFVSSYTIPNIRTDIVANKVKFNHDLEPLSNGSVHFNKSAQIEFGKRYFYVYNGNNISFT